MKPNRLYCDINPTGEGADLTFYADGSSQPTTFSINCEHGLVDLRLKVNLIEPTVLECTQEGFDGDYEVSSSLMPSRSAD